MNELDKVIYMGFTEKELIDLRFVVDALNTTPQKLRNAVGEFLKDETGSPMA